MTRKGDWFQSYTGRRIYVLDPRPEDFVIEDIAHGLANTCRWGGHCRQFYSVAEHSVMVSNLAPPEFALAGLLHDASEAYITDLPRPVKHMPEFSQFREIEDAMQRSIAERFGFPWPLPDAVKVADNLTLAREAKDLMDTTDPEWARWVPPDTERAYHSGLSPLAAERLFLERFHALCQ